MKKIKIKIYKFIEDKFVDIMFDFNKLKNNHIHSDLHFKEKTLKNQKKNKKYKYTILKIFKYRTYETKSKDISNTIKINSYDLIKDFDNLEYFEGLNLNKELMEDELLYKYQHEITEEERNTENNENYKNTIKYLKKNNISDKIIKNNGRVILEHLKTNKDKKSLLKGFLYNKCENNLKDNFTWSETLYGENSCSSGGTGSYDKLDLTKIIFLRCVIKMTEYAPISGGNISELNKIPDFFF